MIKVENIGVVGLEGAVRGMRNPMNSWDKSDSGWCTDLCDNKYCDDYDNFVYVVGPDDLALMRRLYLSGPEHAKYLRMIHVQMDVTAPLYLWKEADQYKVGTTTNSCSTMHKLVAKEFELSDFSHEHLIMPTKNLLNEVIRDLNKYRKLYLQYDSMSEEEKDDLKECGITCKKDIWWQLIQLLPSSYNQKRTWDFDYQTALNIIKQRNNHKLDEWNKLIEILKTLPYIEDIMVQKNEQN